MYKKISFSIVFIISLNCVSFSQNLLLDIQTKNYEQANSYLINKKSGWKFISSGVNSDFFNYNYYKWSCDYNANTNENDSWLSLCQKPGYKNAVIYNTTSEKFKIFKSTISNDSHWKFVESSLDKNGFDHIYYSCLNFYIEFVALENNQILLYNSQEIKQQIVEKERSEFVADSIAKLAEEKRIRDKYILDSIIAIKAKRESDSIREVLRIEAAIEKRNVQGKTYNLRDFDIYNKIYSGIITATADYLKTIPYGKRINAVYKINILVDTNNIATIEPVNDNGSNIPSELLSYLIKSCQTYYNSYPRIKGYHVKAETDLLLPIVYEQGSVKLFKKKNGKINYNRGNPSQEIHGDIYGKLNSKGVYFFDYTEQKIDNKSSNTVTLTNYKKTTVFRTITTVFGSIIGIGGLVTIAVITGAFSQ